VKLKLDSSVSALLVSGSQQNVRERYLVLSPYKGGDRKMEADRQLAYR
jgi:hypothetical protein